LAPTRLSVDTSMFCRRFPATISFLPAFSGYDIIMHEPSDKRSMTDKELDEFSARIRKRMNELGIQYAPPGDEKAKTGSLPP